VSLLRSAADQHRRVLVHLGAGVLDGEVSAASLPGSVVAVLAPVAFDRHEVAFLRVLGEPLVGRVRPAGEQGDQAHQKAADFIPHRQPSLLSVTEGHKLNGGAA
jgi:hypothetical protein